MRHTILICLLTVCHLGAAQFNPRVSSDSIPLNDSVRLTFSTMRAQRAEIDISTAVEAALALPTVRESWRLVGAVDVTEHERIKDLTISLVLAPRRTGTLNLPSIPVPWLEGERSVTFPRVAVREELNLGNEQRSLPHELSGIGGHPWGSDLAAIVAAESGSERQADGSVRTRRGLRLIGSDDRLSEAVMLAGVPLASSLDSLINRWGPAKQHEDGYHWCLGWLRIHAANDAGRTRLHFTHEGIQREAAAERVATDVFRVLDGSVVTTPPSDTANTDADEVTNEAAAPADAATADAPATNSGETQPAIDEIEAEIRRRFNGQ
ncbi:MAG: hypothetical protein ACYTF0_05730 [Planctomycetota bacterium]|jgi:hypothetical protein